MREQAPGARSAAADRRKKAFTLLVRAYSEVRSAVAFFRRAKGDVDDIVPSLYANRTNGRRKEPAPEPQLPVAPPVAAPPTAPHAAPGMPGANPFQN